MITPTNPAMAGQRLRRAISTGSVPVMVGWVGCAVEEMIAMDGGSGHSSCPMRL